MNPFLVKNPLSKEKYLLRKELFIGKSYSIKLLFLLML